MPSRIPGCLARQLSADAVKANLSFKVKFSALIRSARQLSRGDLCKVLQRLALPLAEPQFFYPALPRVNPLWSGSSG